MLTRRLAMAALLGVTALFPACRYVSTAHAAGATNLTIKADSTASDAAVSAIVEVRADSGTKCSGIVYKAHLHASLPSLTLTTSGTSYWQWRIDRHVSAGTWTVVVSCAGRGWKGRRLSHFPAVAGVGPGRQDELFAPHSLTDGSVKGTATTSGVGGGGHRSLYPKGQCTWWVSLLRPDLPWFPGAEGTAANWVVAAEKRGISTGAKPEIGAVVVFAPGQYGSWSVWPCRICGRGRRTRRHDHHQRAQLQGQPSARYAHHPIAWTALYLPPERQYGSHGSSGAFCHHAARRTCAYPGGAVDQPCQRDDRTWPSAHVD